MKSKLSILIYSLANGGAERVVSILLSTLKDKYKITLVLMNDTLFYDAPKEIEIVYLEDSSSKESGIKKFLKLPFLGWKYKNICKSQGTDISLSFMNRPNYINIFAKLFGSDVKTIVSERAMPSLQHKHGLEGFINRSLIQLLYPLSNTIIANSDGNTKDLKDNFSIKNVLTISNLIDIDKINILAGEDIDFKNDKFTFITVGRLDFGKNHKLIIDSMKKIDGYLYIIGDGVLQMELEKWIEDLNLEEKVFLLGRQSNPYKYLSKADCFVFSSNHEGFPNVLLEALACGLPVISTDCQSGPREILASSRNFKRQLNDDIETATYGILVPINDKKNITKAMKLMINDKNLRDCYKQKAIIRANDFNVDKIVKKWIEVIS